LPLEEIARLEQLEGAEINDAKKVLATETTALAHGRAAAEEAAETAQRTFAEGLAAAGLPTIEVAASELESGFGVLTALVTAGLVATNSEARRQIKGAGVRVNDEPVSDERAVLTMKDANNDGVIKLSLGKKRHVLVRPV
jgi:tyrosyl-tRNA synthetase